MTTILDDIKKLLGISVDYTHFDSDISILIEDAIAVLKQVGVQTNAASDSEWTDFSDDEQVVSLCKTYIYLSVRLIFDPPQNSFVVDAYKNRLDELTSRISYLVDPEKKENEVLLGTDNDSDV